MTDPAPDDPAMVGTWEERLAGIWDAAGAGSAEALREDMAALLSELSAGHPIALFERASVEDFLGEEAAAIPLYRAALDAGLDGPRRTQALIQLASSLRNVGDASGAIATLRRVPDDDPLAGAARAFLALALHDDDKPTPALRTALRALAPTLPAYRRAVSAYAAELPARERVRAIAVGLIVRDGWVLAEEYAATASRGAFLRAPGGGIDFGETAAAAIRREMREELGAAVQEAELVDVVESIFDDGRKRGHEIAFVFGIRSRELEELPHGSRIDVIDGDTTVGWYRLDDLRAGTIPFYPAGILAVADRLG